MRITGINPATNRGMGIDVCDGIIVAITDQDSPQDGYLSAGFVDLQVNGYGGLDLNASEMTPDTVYALCQKMLDLGVTTFLPTLITSSEQNIIKALSSIASARRDHAIVAQMVHSVHVEGPSVSSLDGPRGAHPLNHVRPPSLEEFNRWQEACGGLVSLVTLAPEQPGSLEYIQKLTSQDVHVSLGHTHATPAQITDSIKAGACLSTHLGNGAAAQIPRHPNFIWAQLAHDELCAMFIADGHHLPADTFKAMLGAKGLKNSILVSDAVALAGMKPGVYMQNVGGKVELSEDGRISMFGTPYLAGAGLPLSVNIAKAMEMANLSLWEALQLATRNPGRFAGGRGVLEVGQRADIVRFAIPQNVSRLDIKNVWLAGVLKAGT